MTKQVLVQIKGLQMIEEQGQDSVEVVTAGEYYHRNGSHFVLFDEVFEGISGITKNTIRIKPKLLEVSKKGVANVHMVFEEGKKNETWYSTPFGRMQMGFSATNIEVTEDEHNIDARVDYSLEMNNEYIADCNIFINIKSKDAMDFSLMS